MPETFPGADLGEEETCACCRQHRVFQPLGEDELRALLTSRKGEVYDCVVPVSGGKDSTYVLYYVTQKLGLRAIAVNYDSGFQGQLAMDNAENLCEKLAVPLVRKPVNQKRQVKMLREILKVSEPVGGFFRVCGNCETGIRSSALSVAREWNVPAIVVGDDRNEILRMQLSFQGTRAFLRKLTERKRAIPEVLYHLAKYSLFSIQQRGELGVPLRWRFLPIRTLPWPKDGVEVVHFFDYVSWEPKRTAAFIKEHLGWKSPEGHEARFDCLLHCFPNYQWLQETQVSSDAFIDCELLREGQADRQQVLEEEERRIREVREQCRQALAALGMESSRTL